MEFDLNREPPNDSMFGLQTLLSELETAHGCIEERIRQLEAVISRTRQRQIWRQNQTTPQTVDTPVQATASGVQSGDTLVSEGIIVPIQGRISEVRKFVKKNNTHLIAEALGRETDARKTRIDKRGFFDCNICLDMARDPILTSCGHLFCWPCFYSLSYIGLSDVKECPACMEKVTDKSIIPIYGNENVTNTQKMRFKESGLKVPPRPNAHRIEGLRQKLSTRREVSSLTFRNTQLPNVIAATEERSQSQNRDGVLLMAERPSNSHYVRNQFMRSMPTEGIQQLSRLLDRSDSISSLSSALNSLQSSAERLYQDLEASINSHHMRRISRQSSSDVDRDSISSIVAIIQQDSQTVNNAADIDSTMAQTTSSSRSSDAAFMQLENQRTDYAAESNNVMPVSSSSSRRAELSRISEVSTGIEVNSTTPNSSSSRRRREVPMNSDVENDRLRDPIRRRLM